LHFDFGLSLVVLVSCAIAVDSFHVSPPLVSRRSLSFGSRTIVGLSASTVESEEPKRPRGRPRLTNPAAPKTVKKKRLTIVEQQDEDENREILTPTLVIVAAEGLPGDHEVLDSIKERCTELYGNSLFINEFITAADDDDVAVDTSEGDSIDSSIDTREDYDPALLEMWIETKAGVLRLMSRRSKNPLILSSEVVSEVMEGIAEYMDPDHYLTVEQFRDDTNRPDLS